MCCTIRDVSVFRPALVMIASGRLLFVCKHLGRCKLLRPRPVRLGDGSAAWNPWLPHSGDFPIARHVVFLTHLIHTGE